MSLNHLKKITSKFTQINKIKSDKKVYKKVTNFLLILIQLK